MGEKFEFAAWPTEHRYITQVFGANPRYYAQFGLPGHDGIDIRAPSGSKIFSVAAGEVYRLHTSATGHNYGIHLRVRHAEGYRTVFAHLEKILVHEGQQVEAGDLIGLADSTGNSFGSHLHLTLKKDGAEVDDYPHNIIDPLPFMLPLLGWSDPAGPFVEGWVLLDVLTRHQALAQVNPGGGTLYVNQRMSIFIPEGTIVGFDKEIAPFARVRVARAAVGLDNIVPSAPAPDPPPLISTIEGWTWKRYVTIIGGRGVAGIHGLNLLAEPSASAGLIGILKANRTVIIKGTARDEYLPVSARRDDFFEPVILPDPPPSPAKLPPDDGVLGWVLSQYLDSLDTRQALTSRLGVNLRSKPDSSGQNIGLLKAFATVAIAGKDRAAYTPVLVRKADVLNAPEMMPEIELPEPRPQEELPAEPPITIQPTVPGWSFTNGLKIDGDVARVAQYGSNLRAQPRRDAEKIGLIPSGTILYVMGPPHGEYTPVRVAKHLLEQDSARYGPTDTLTLGRARIGLHASADPTIGEREHQEFAQMRPGIIKVLSMHPAKDIARLAEAHPGAAWIVRAFLKIKGRRITTEQFLNDTIGDVRRTLGPLKGRQVVVELHNEPNLVEEGLGTSWADGQAFSHWFRQLLQQYRQALPGTHFIYPGLSPGSAVSGVKADHIQFIEASREAVLEADGLGVHVYWSQVHPMEMALETIDDTISRFRNHPIWISEASWKQANLTAAEMARSYLRFWSELQSRPTVQGVTYFVASASNPIFANEAWLGRGIARLIGRR